MFPGFLLEAVGTAGLRSVLRLHRQMPSAWVRQVRESARGISWSARLTRIPKHEPTTR